MVEMMMSCSDHKPTIPNPSIFVKKQTLGHARSAVIALIVFQLDLAQMAQRHAFTRRRQMDE